MTQYTELERAAHVVVILWDYYRKNNELFSNVLDVAITGLQGALIEAELAGQQEAPAFDADRWREIAAQGFKDERRAHLEQTVEAIRELYEIWNRMPDSDNWAARQTMLDIGRELDRIGTQEAGEQP